MAARLRLQCPTGTIKQYGGHGNERNNNTGSPFYQLRIISRGGLIGETVGFEAVRVWHCNDAKAACGSRLDRHEHIGEGTIGAAAFRRLLRDGRFAHAAFIAETPVDDTGDEARNVGMLRALAGLV